MKYLSKEISRLICFNPSTLQPPALLLTASLHNQTILFVYCFPTMLNTIIYDGECNLCNSVVRFVRKHDHVDQFYFVALQSEEGQGLINKIGLPEKDRNTAIYIISDRFYIRSTAVLHILKDLGRGWQIFYAFIIVPRVIRDFVYKLIARYRYRFNI
jgi:predicted DCC family thiol-disulfide oxidoreductase YuxK